MDGERERIRAAPTAEAARRIGRSIARRHKRDPDLAAVLDLARRLWRGRPAERAAAVEMVATLDRHLDAEHWPLFRQWIQGPVTRELADDIAIHILGAIVARDRTFVRVLRHWALSTKASIRRAAVLGVFRRARQMGDVEAAISVCEPLMRDRSREVGEAVERVLRECAEVDEPLTREFVERWAAVRR